MSNDPVTLQTMLNRLHAYAQRKHLVINIAKSEVVHFNSSGSDLPVFSIGGGGWPLAHKDSFKCLGMMFHKSMSMAKSPEHAAGPFMASTFRLECKQTKCGALSTLVQARNLQVPHMSYLKSTLGVKRTTANWAALRECGHEPLQFYWF
eukprot:421032-Pelagomonas_calceolata.AAC.1